MSVTRAQKARLGIFVTSGLVLLIGGLVALAGARLGEKRDAYSIRYAEGALSLSGLDVGSPVKYSGIRVGRVDKIGVDPADLAVVVVEISLDEGTPVAKDSKANLGSLGITGLKYIELSRGTNAAGLRAAGESIPPGSSGLDDLTQQAEEIAGKVNSALDRVNAFLDPEMKARAASVLERSDRLLGTLEATVAENRVTLKSLGQKLDSAIAQADGLMGELEGTAERVNRVLDRSGPQIRRSTAAAARLLEGLNGTRGRLDASLKSITALTDQGRETLGSKGMLRTLTQVDTLVERTSLLVIQSRESILQTFSYLREAAENLGEFSRRLREDPSLLLLGDDDDGGEP